MFGHNVGTRCPEQGITLWECMKDSMLLFPMLSKIPKRSNLWDENLILAHGSKCSQSSVVGRHGHGCGSGLVAGACGYTREQRNGPRTWGKAASSDLP